MSEKEDNQARLDNMIRKAQIRRDAEKANEKHNPPKTAVYRGPSTPSERHAGAWW